MEAVESKSTRAGWLATRLGKAGTDQADGGQHSGSIWKEKERRKKKKKKKKKKKEKKKEKEKIYFSFKISNFQS